MKSWRILGAAVALSATGAVGLVCSRSAPLDGVAIDPIRAFIAEVDQSRLMTTVEDFVRAHQEDTPLDCEAFDSEHPNKCVLTRHNARALMRQRFEALGYTVRTQDDDDGIFSTSNLIADRPGSTRPDEVVLVGAHYDAFHAGADDNSTGVAAVLELARLAAEKDFDRTVRFVGFDLEEFGLIGSTRFVNAGAGGGQLVASMIFDCIGFASEEEDSQTSLVGLPAPTVGNFVTVIANDRSSKHATELWALNEALDLMPMAAVIAPSHGAYPVTGNLMRSDHAPFWLADKPAVFLTDTANFRNPHYHLDTDTVDTLNPAFLTNVVRVSAAALSLWAGGPR